MSLKERVKRKLEKAAGVAPGGKVDRQSILDSASMEDMIRVVAKHWGYTDNELQQAIQEWPAADNKQDILLSLKNDILGFGLVFELDKKHEDIRVVAEEVVVAPPKSKEESAYAMRLGDTRRHPHDEKYIYDMLEQMPTGVRGEVLTEYSARYIDPNIPERDRRGAANLYLHTKLEELQRAQDEAHDTLTIADRAELPRADEVDEALTIGDIIVHEASPQEHEASPQEKAQVIRRSVPRRH